MMPQVKDSVQSNALTLSPIGGLSEVVAQHGQKFLDVGARVTSYILANDNDVKTDFEILSSLTATILSPDKEETELGRNVFRTI